MAPRVRAMASRHLVCGTCISWVDFDSSGCTNSWAEMRGGTGVFACEGCRDVAMLVGEVEELWQMMESMKRIVTGLGLEEKLEETADRMAELGEEKCELVTGHTTVTIGVVYRYTSITKQNNEKIHNAIREVSKGDCIIMGVLTMGILNGIHYRAHPSSVEDQTLLCLVQDNFLTQNVLEPTRAARILDKVLSSQK